GADRAADRRRWSRNASRAVVTRPAATRRRLGLQRRLQRRGRAAARGVCGLGGNGVDDLLLLFDGSLVVIAVAEDPEGAGDAAVGLQDDAGEDLLALLEAEALDVEVG